MLNRAFSMKNPVSQGFPTPQWEGMKRGTKRSLFCPHPSAPSPVEGGGNCFGNFKYLWVGYYYQFRIANVLSFVGQASAPARLIPARPDPTEDILPEGVREGNRVFYVFLD